MLYRLARVQFPDPAYFGRAALFRFDAPDRSFGVCYLGTSLDCCLLEVMTPTYRATTVPHLIIIRAQPSSYYAATVTVTLPLRLALSRCGCRPNCAH